MKWFSASLVIFSAALLLGDPLPGLAEPAKRRLLNRLKTQKWLEQKTTEQLKADEKSGKAISGTGSAAASPTTPTPASTHAIVIGGKAYNCNTQAAAAPPCSADDPHCASRPSEQTDAAAPAAEPGDIAYRAVAKDVWAWARQNCRPVDATEKKIQLHLGVQLAPGEVNKREDLSGSDEMFAPMRSARRLSPSVGVTAQF